MRSVLTAPAVLAAVLAVAAPAAASAPPDSAPPGASTPASSTPATDTPVRTGRLGLVDDAGDVLVAEVSLDADEPIGEPELVFDTPESGEEAPAIFVDGIAFDAAGETVYVGTCCEPASGQTFAIDRASGDELDPIFGSAPTLSPDATTMAFVAGIELALVDVASGERTSIPTEGFTPWSVAWAGTDTLAVFGIVSEDQSAELRLIDRESGEPFAATKVAGGFDPWIVQLAGVDTEGSLVVFEVPADGDPGTINRYSLRDLSPVGDPEELPAPALSASLAGDGETLAWLDADGALHLGPLDGDLDTPPVAKGFTWVTWA